MPESSFEQTSVMNANKSTTITQYTTENLNQKKIAIGQTQTTRSSH